MSPLCCDSPKRSSACPPLPPPHTPGILPLRPCASASSGKESSHADPTRIDADVNAESDMTTILSRPALAAQRSVFFFSSSSRTSTHGLLRCHPASRPRALGAGSAALLLLLRLVRSPAPATAPATISCFTTTTPRHKQNPPRPKPPPEEEITEAYLKGSGPGGQKIVRLVFSLA